MSGLFAAAHPRAPAGRALLPGLSARCSALRRVPRVDDGEVETVKVPNIPCRDGKIGGLGSPGDERIPKVQNTDQKARPRPQSGGLCGVRRSHRQNPLFVVRRERRQCRLDAVAVPPWRESVRAEVEFV